MQLLVRAGDGPRPLRQGLGLLDHSLMNARPRDRPRDRPRPTGPHHRTRNRALDPGFAGRTRARSGDGAPAVSRIAGESMEFATVARAQKRCSMTLNAGLFVRFERLPRRLKIVVSPVRVRVSPSQEMRANRLVFVPRLGHEMSGYAPRKCAKSQTKSQWPSARRSIALHRHPPLSEQASPTATYAESFEGSNPSLSVGAAEPS